MTSAEVTPTLPATKATDLTGNWLLNLDVVATSGVCDGQENDGAYVENIKIVQTGETVAVTGVVGATEPSWAGTFDGPPSDSRATKRMTWARLSTNLL